MNRRKPPSRLAVVPREAGQDLHGAVLHKASTMALSCLEEQAEPAALSAVLPFAAGYLAGFARHQCLRHGVDPEEGESAMLNGLLDLLSALAPPVLSDEIRHLRFGPRTGPGLISRARLRAASERADAGYILGHLESLCGSRRLLQAAARLHGSARAAEDMLTACDTAADRMQSHHPTLSLRLEPAERDVLRAAFSHPG